MNKYNPEQLLLLGRMPAIQKKIGKDLESPDWWALAADILEDEGCAATRMARRVSEKLKGPHSLCLCIQVFKESNKFYYSYSQIEEHWRVQQLTFEDLDNIYLYWRTKEREKEKTWRPRDFADCILFQTIEMPYYLTLGKNDTKRI